MRSAVRQNFASAELFRKAKQGRFVIVAKERGLRLRKGPRGGIVRCLRSRDFDIAFADNILNFERLVEQIRGKLRKRLVPASVLGHRGGGSDRAQLAGLERAASF